jgi:acetate kinase
MAILAVNSGSSSLKVTLFRVRYQRLERIIDFEGKSLGSQTLLAFQGKKVFLRKAFSINTCLTAVLEIMHEGGFPSPACVAHRFVHGGENFRKTALLTPAIRLKLKTLVRLAPLHNQSCYQGIEWGYRFFKNAIPQFVVFDTAFFRDLPKEATTYAIPQRLSKRYSILRYGFHGISHQFLWKRLIEEKRNARKAITLHLGSGCSAAAIEKGRPLDTSMGFTPLEGLVMGTRSGDLDPSLIDYLIQKEGMTAHEVIDLLNFQSGLLGISGITSDMATLWKIRSKDKNARFAIDLFCYRIRKYIGAYLSVLKGCDALILSGGIGENSPGIRKQILKEMQWLGIILDDRLNQKAKRLSPGAVRKISSDRSAIAVYVIATDENAAMAHEAKEAAVKDSF